MQRVDHLVVAALDGDRETLRAALTADPELWNARTMFGVGIAHAAHYGGHPELVDELGFRVGPQLAAELGRLDLLQLEGDVPATTPLHGAAYFG